MSNWKRTNRSGSCPICDNTNGDCRISHESELVLCIKNYSDDFRHLGYKFTQPTKNGLWGIYVPLRDYDKDYSEARKETYQKAKQEREKAKLESHKDGLSVDERDKNIRLIHQYLGLSRSDRQKLRERGLTDEQINNGLYFSVKGYTEIPDSISTKLAGIFIGGNGKPTIKGDKKGSIACVAFNAEGKAIGWQYRHARKENKYTWAKGDKSSHLSNGELPLTAIHKSDSKDVYLSEGILKPYIASHRLELNFIGASGFNFTGGKQQVKDIIARHCYERAIFTMDAGAVVNPLIMRQFNKNIKLLDSVGLECYVLWWGQVTKESSDIDELDNLDHTEIITIEQFLALAREHGYTNDNTDQEEFDKEAWKARKEAETKANQKKLRELTTIDYQTNKRYWDTDEVLSNIPHYFTGILGLKGGKGTGKSHLICHLKRDEEGRIIDELGLLRRFRDEGLNVIGLNVRRALAEESSYRWGLDFINNGNSAADKWRTAVNSMHIALCPESLTYLQDRSSEEKICVIIDECETFINQLLTSSTTKQRRGQILLAFEELFRKVHNNGGLFILSDADLSERTINFFQEVANKVNGKPLPCLTFVNNYKYSGREFYLLTEIAEARTKIYKNADEGIKTLIPTDNKEEADALEKVLNNKYPDLKIININRDTVKEDKYIRSFITKPNSTFAEEKPDICIYTPSMGMGVSIDIKGLFDEVVGIFCGNIPTEQIRQALWRYRELIPMYIFARNKSSRYRYDISFEPETNLKNSLTRKKENIDATDLLKELNDCEDDSELVEAIRYLWDDQAKTWNCPYLRAIATIEAMNNYCFNHYREMLREQLEEVENNKYCFYETASDKSFDDEIKNSKQESKLIQATNLSQAKDIEFELAQELAKNPEKLTKQQELEVQKAFLQKELPLAQLSPSFCHFIIQDYRKGLNSLKFEWYRQNMDASKYYDRKKWRSYLHDQSKGNISLLSDVKISTNELKLINKLKIDKILSLSDTNQIISKDSPVIKDFRRKALSLKKDIKRTFGYSITPRTHIIKFLNHLLCKLGYKTISIKGKKGKYQVTDKYPDERLIVNQALTLKYRQDLKESPNPVTHNEYTTIRKCQKNGGQNLQLDSIESFVSNKIHQERTELSYLNKQGSVLSEESVIQKPSGIDIVTQEVVNSEPNEENKAQQKELVEKPPLGELVEYWHPRKPIPQRGVIEKIDENCWYLIRDCIENVLIPCAEHQFEVVQ